MMATARRAPAKPKRLTVTHNLSGQRLGRKGQQTRERIMQALLDLLLTSDAGEINLAAIARETSIGLSSIYNYFPDFGALLLAVLEREIDQEEQEFTRLLTERWPDETLEECALAFVCAHFAFWQSHAPLLHLRNRFADARDLRLLEYRRRVSRPTTRGLIWQMDADPEAPDQAIDDCATVMFTGLERVATVLSAADFTVISGEQERLRLVSRLAIAEATVIEVMVREMRKRPRPA